MVSDGKGTIFPSNGKAFFVFILIISVILPRMGDEILLGNCQNENESWR